MAHKSAKTAPPEALTPVYVSHQGIETYSEKYFDETGKPCTRYFLQIQVNGEKLQVECNCSVEIPERFAEAIRGLIQKQEEERQREKGDE